MYFIFFNLQVALLFHSYHKCSESVFSFIRPAPLPFPIWIMAPQPPAQTRNQEVRLASYHFPHHISLFSTSLIFLQSFLNFQFHRNSFIEAYTSSLVEVWSLLWVQRHVYFKLCSREQVLEVVVLQFDNVWKGMGSNIRINIPLRRKINTEAVFVYFNGFMCIWFHCFILRFKNLVIYTDNKNRLRSSFDLDFSLIPHSHSSLLSVCSFFVCFVLTSFIYSTNIYWPTIFCLQW